MNFFELLRNNEVAITVVAATALILMLFAFFIISVLVAQKRKQKSKAEFLQLQNENELLQKKYETEILRSQLEIQEQTLQHISQEIHDNIGQVLSLAQLNLGTLQDHQPEKNREKIDSSRQMVSQALQGLRALSHSLHTGLVGDRGFLESVAYELERVGKAGDIKTRFDSQGPSFEPDKQKELVLFRIVQEILANILKHARASEIVIYLRHEEKQLQLSITDNGIGFDPPQDLAASRTLGLRNLYNRAALIGARITIESRPGNGTAIALCLPL